jgi:hypothetical protein
MASPCAWAGVPKARARSSASQTSLYGQLMRHKKEIIGVAFWHWAGYGTRC